MTIRPKFIAALPALLLTIPGRSDDHKLTQQTGVYNASKTGQTPGFVVDPARPQPLPNHSILAQLGGLYVDRHDHIWVYNRPRSLTTEEAGLETAIPGAKDDTGQPINGLGQVRAYGPIADCCKAAPSVLEFDSTGKLLRSWGGPADPGFIGGKCKAQAGCIWPSSEHGIYVDQNDNVWISGNSAAAGQGGTPWTTNKEGGDGFVLKFVLNGNFKMRSGGTPKGPKSKDTP